MRIPEAAHTLIPPPIPSLKTGNALRMRCVLQVSTGSGKRLLSGDDTSAHLPCIAQKKSCKVQNLVYISVSMLLVPIVIAFDFG